MDHRLYMAAVAAILSVAGQSAAQGVDAAPPQAVVADTVAIHTVQPSLIDRPSAAIRRSDLVPPAPLPASSQHLGEAKAEMIVGGAAFVAGALMDNDAGSVLMLGGAVVGLYGLWNYLK
jgi:hypothetical protein